MLRALSFLNYAGKHLIYVITNERLFIMELLQTAQGGNKLVYNGNTYIIKKKNIGSIRWVCTQKVKTGCSGAVTTDDPMGNPRKETPHNLAQLKNLGHFYISDTPLTKIFCFLM